MLDIPRSGQRWPQQFGRLLAHAIALSRQGPPKPNGVATWIRNWIDQSFDPGETVPILDHYHAVAYLHGFAGKTIKGESSKEQWVARQKELLLQGQVGRAIDNIDRTLAVQRAKSRILTYCRAGRDRMDIRDIEILVSGPQGQGLWDRPIGQ